MAVAGPARDAPGRPLRAAAASAARRPAADGRRRRSSGFAARGPVDMPVAVEDLGRFAAVFGGDVALGWDAERGEQATAQLRPAVARLLPQRRPALLGGAGRERGGNGGAVPAPRVLVSLPASPNGTRPTARAGVRASSVGGWAADLAVGAALEVASISGRRFRTIGRTAP